jgi:hypothetical protein
MVRHAASLMILVIYFLTPYSIKNINLACQCGCEEIFCTCCGKPEDFGDVTSFSECHCNIPDETYEEPPALVHSFQMGIVLDQIGIVLCSDNDSISPGYHDPPMKPPPPV